MTIREATPEDFPAILALNADWEHVTSPLSAGSLAALHAQSAYHRVLVDDRTGEVLAFLLAVGPGQDYDSPNYRWFDDAGPADFLYIDRIIVSMHAHRGGLGTALYDDVATFACERGDARLVCEVDVRPRNEVSDEFHRRRGFSEVGRQAIREGAKEVSLRELTL